MGRSSREQRRGNEGRNRACRAPPTGGVLHRVRLHSPPVAPVTLVLASASPARLMTLRNAGIEPVVEVSRVDESLVTDPDPARLAATLARLKGCRGCIAASGARTGRDGGWCSAATRCWRSTASPTASRARADVAAERLRQLRGRSAYLHTGHHLTDLATGSSRLETATTTVMFGGFDEVEIEAYVATGEPLQVAGAFTIDGIGGAFVERRRRRPAQRGRAVTAAAAPHGGRARGQLAARCGTAADGCSRSGPGSHRSVEPCGTVRAVP